MTTGKAIAVLDEMLGLENMIMIDTPLPAISERIEALQFAIDKLRGRKVREPFVRSGWQDVHTNKIKSLNISGHGFEVKKEKFTQYLFVYSQEIKKYLLRDGSLNDRTTIEKDGQTFLAGWFENLDEVDAAVEKYYMF